MLVPSNGAPCSRFVRVGWAVAERGPTARNAEYSVYRFRSRWDVDVGGEPITSSVRAGCLQGS